MLKVSQIGLDLDAPEDILPELAAQKLRLAPGQIQSWRIAQKSVDARKKSDVHFVYSLYLMLTPKAERRVLANPRLEKFVRPAAEEKPQTLIAGRFAEPPVVVGAGPAGLFAALILAKAGACPILLERGADVDQRTHLVKEFWQRGKLNPASNVQFGEGGAGAFSDGKLTTGTHDPMNRQVLHELAAAGAPAEILYLAKPHVGTDKLRLAVKNLRRRIIALGGTVLFEHQLTNISIKNGAVAGLSAITPHGEQQFATANIILAPGHSARDTFRMLNAIGVPLEPKPFAIGVRAEHLQSDLNRAQYGDFAGHPKLPPADYKLVTHLDNGRTVYSFCMCPGGQVVAAASEAGGVVTNGMSYHARSGLNANAALLVSVNPNDFASDSPLAGIDFQRRIEKPAYQMAGESYYAPCQMAGDFLMKRTGHGFGHIKPSYAPGVVPADLHALLPDFVAASLAQGIRAFGQRLAVYQDMEAPLTAPETRSSSPVRIPRDATRQSIGLTGLYPCGEGAGYAGGIVSAAADGIRTALAVLQNSLL